MRGSCACGAIEYELNGSLEWMNHCHCTICRKTHGAAFGTFGHGKASEFRWISGEEKVRQWRSSPGNTRNFCEICGSNMPTVSGAEDHVRIPMGAIDDNPQYKPKEHYYLAFKASWYELTDELPRHERLP